MTNSLCNSDFSRFKIESEKFNYFRDVLSLSFDGQYIAYSISRGFIYINDLKNKKYIQTFDLYKDKDVKDVKDDNYLIYTYDIIWHPFEKDIISSAHNNNCVNLWNIKTGEKIGSLNPNSHMLNKKRELYCAINTISWSPNGKFIACGTTDFTIIIWDILSNQTSIIKSHNGWISSILWSLDGKKLISASYDHTINLWNVSSKKTDIQVLPSILPEISIKQPQPPLKDVSFIELTLCKTFKEHNNIIYNLSLSPCGQFLACSGFDKIINIWNIITLEHKSRFEYNCTSIPSMKWLPDGETIAIYLDNSDNSICFLNINTGIKKLEIKFNNTGYIVIDFSLYDWTFALSTCDQSIYIYNYFGKENELSSTLSLILATKNKKAKHTKRVPTELWDLFAFEFLKLF